MKLCLLVHSSPTFQLLERASYIIFTHTTKIYYFDHKSNYVPIFTSLLKVSAIIRLIISLFGHLLLSFEVLFKLCIEHSRFVCYFE